MHSYDFYNTQPLFHHAVSTKMSFFNGSMLRFPQGPH